MVVLDTDILSLVEWEMSAVSQKLRQRFSQYPPSEIHASIISFDEQMRGWTAYIGRAKNMSQEIQAYQRLRRQLKLYCKLPMVDFDEPAAVRYQSLRRQFRRLNANDLKIASITLAHQATTLVSRNMRDFKLIPGLMVEDWTR